MWNSYRSEAKEGLFKQNFESTNKEKGVIKLFTSK